MGTQIRKEPIPTRATKPAILAALRASYRKRLPGKYLRDIFPRSSPDEIERLLRDLEAEGKVTIN